MESYSKPKEEVWENLSGVRIGNPRVSCIPGAKEICAMKKDVR